MNDADLKTLIHFADLVIKYNAEDDEYHVSGLWTNLDAMRNLEKRIKALIPVVSAIVDHYS